MEKIEAELKEAETKQRSLRKAYECVHAQATALIIFAVQWKDLEEHFESTRYSLESRFRELAHRETVVRVRDEELAEKQMKFYTEVESKADELGRIQILIDEKAEEVLQSKNHLHSLQSLILEHNDEVMVQEKRLMEVESFVGEKKRECDSIERRVKERMKKLNWVERMVEEKSKLAELKAEKVRGFEEALEKCVEKTELKERELNEIIGSIEERKEEFSWIGEQILEAEKLIKVQEEQLDLKEEKFKEVQKAVEECEKELKLRAERIKEAERAVEECDKELKMKKEKLSAMEKSLVECSNAMESRETKIREMDSKKDKDFCLRERSLEEWSCKLEFKERELVLKERNVELKAGELRKSKEEGEKYLESLSQGLKEKENQLQGLDKELRLKQKELDLIKKSTQERAKDLELKERQLEDQAKECSLKQIEFNSIKKFTEERSQNLELKERQLEDQAKELELKQKEFDSIKKFSEERSQKLNLKERQLEDRAKELELKHKEFDSLKKFSEEHTQNLKAKENTSIFLSQVKIEQLEQIPANNAVVPSLTSNQSSVNMDGRGSLLFINEHLKNYVLVGSEISAVLQVSPDPAKLVLDSMQGFYHSNSRADKSGCGFDLSITRVSCILLLETLKSISPKINPEVKEEAIKLAGDWKVKMTTGTENCLDVLCFLRFVSTYGITSFYDAIQSLCAIVAEDEHTTELSCALGISDKAPDFIRNLIEKKQLIEAVRLICPFKLIDKFHPVPLLKEFVENAKRLCIQNSKRSKSLDEKDKCMNNQIADLRVVIQCINDCNLEFEYPSRFIETRIAFLEKLKEDRRRPKTSPPSKVEQHNQKNSPVSKVEQQEQKKAPASKVEGQEQKKSHAPRVEGQEQKKSAASKGVGQEQKKSPSSRVEGQEHIESLASNVEQGAAKPLASIVEGREQTISVPSKVEPEHHRSGQKVEGQEQKKSHASRVEGQEQKKSAASKGAAQEQKKSPSSNVEQGAEKPPASTVEQEQHRRGQKRRPNTLPRRFQPQQQRQSKYHRTSESIGPGYRKPSLWHENHRHRGQFGRDANSYEIGANAGTGFTAIPNPRPCVPH